MDQLVDLVKRLEAVTTRLEGQLSQSSGSDIKVNGLMDQDDLLAPQPFKGLQTSYKRVEPVVPVSSFHPPENLPLSVEMSSSYSSFSMSQTNSSPVSPPSGHYSDSSETQGPFPPAHSSISPTPKPKLPDWYYANPNKPQPPPIKPRKTRISSDSDQPVSPPMYMNELNKSEVNSFTEKPKERPRLLPKPETNDVGPPLPLTAPPSAYAPAIEAPRIAGAITASPNAQNSCVAVNAQNVSPGEIPRMVELYDEILNGPLAKFLGLSNKIGGDVSEVANLAKRAFSEQRVFIWNACGMKKASQEQLTEMLTNTSNAIEALGNFKNSHRTSKQFNHLSAVSEPISALGWVTVEPAPAPFVKEMGDASQFYTNRVLKEFKEKDQTHVDWVKSWLETLKELHQYVKQNHTTGLVWNSSPGSTPSGASIGSAPPASVPPPPGPPPPPPPPPPVDLLRDGKEQDSEGSDTRAALFADINKGLDITKTLKKITPDMQTHKNPTLREEAVSDKTKPPPKPPKPAHLSNGGAVGGKPEPTPKCELEGGKKWVVEFYKNNPQITVNVENMKQVVYIYKCQNCVIQIKGKVNSITIDSCKKTSVVFDNLVSSCEVINSQSAQIQTFGTMPTLAIQKTDGCQVYLSKESLDSEIVTSKSSEMNILVPDENGEFNEFAVPEQYKTVVKGKRLTTTAVDIS